MATYYKIDNDKTIFTGDGELIYFVPEKYFELKVAQIYGQYVELIGIFDYGLFDAKGKKLKIGRFNLPTKFKCMPKEIRKEKNFKLEGTKEAKDYRLLCFYKGDELISSNHVPKDVSNVEMFVNLLFGANLPDNIPYDDLYKYMLNNADANGFNYNAPPQLIGLLISELCRDARDLSKEFRYTDMKDMTAYKMIPIARVPKYASPYQAITSENADEAVAFAMTAKNNIPSPLEHIMMEDTVMYNPDDFFSEEYVPFSETQQF